MRCNFIGNLVDFQYQVEWRGTRLMNTNLLVCTPCLDDPQRQLGTLILPPDPVGIANAMPEQYPLDEVGYIMFEQSTPYPNGGRGARMEGEPWYTEYSTETEQFSILLETSTYSQATP